MKVALRRLFAQIGTLSSLTYDIAHSGIGRDANAFRCYLLAWILEIKSHHAMELQILKINVYMINKKFLNAIIIAFNLNAIGYITRTIY